jgi:tetratricopeptide (TPR) repeat protein
VALAPSDGDAKFNLGLQLATLGELQPAIDLTRQALATDPLRGVWYATLAFYLLASNRFDEAHGAIDKAIELQPAAAYVHCILTFIEVQRGNAQAALAAAQQEVPGPWQDNALAIARQIGTDRRAADAALRTLVEKDAGFPYSIAEVYALRNDAKATFEWLDRAWSSRDSGIIIMMYDPFILRYRDDPRFAAFCRKVGLPVPREASARKSP